MRRDYVQETAELNARVRELVGEAQLTAEVAIESRQPDALVESLRATLDLLLTLADDLTRSRAESAYGYVVDPDFRRVVNRITQGD